MRRWTRLGPPLVSVLLLGLALWGAKGQLGIVSPEYVMVTRPDRQAMTWIREHTPTQAKFLVEGFRIYGGRSAVGADAGWWIPLLAERANTMPPQYAMLNEAPIIPNYTQQVVDLVEILEHNAAGFGGRTARTLRGGGHSRLHRSDPGTDRLRCSTVVCA